MAVATEIRVRLNGEERSVPAGLSVAALLAHLGLNPALVVVEHNAVILRRDRLDDATVGDGDQLEVVHFVGGG